MAFTLATWNILATGYIRPAFYPGTPRDILDPKWREPALVRHAKALGVEILCLQEVETSAFQALEAGLSGSGFSGLHALKNGRKPDGCAVFYRSDLFALVSSRRIPYADGGEGPDSGHIAQLLILDHGGKRLALLNTHLKWDPPETPRERQWGHRQALQALAALHSEAGPDAGQILCGDFNVTPASDVVETLLAAGLDYAHRGQAGVCTCNSNREAKLIDYLFSNNTLRARPILPAPIDGHTPLPSAEQPSDHLALVAEFDWA